jgi:hypothetical protein
MKKPQCNYDLNRKPIRVEQLHRMPKWGTAKPVASIRACEVQPAQFTAGEPVVISGGLTEWKALDAWESDNYLRKKAGDCKLTVTPFLLLDALLMKITGGTEPCEALEFSLEKYLQLLSTDYDPDKILYARNIPIPDALSTDVSRLPFISRPEMSRSAFIGRRSYTDSHEHHGCDAFMCQVRGTKEVILHPPDRRHKRALYANRYTQNWSPVRFFDVDEEAFPLFVRLNTPWRAIVRPGDALYIPDPWWHSVISLDDEIQITLTYWFDLNRESLLP